MCEELPFLSRYFSLSVVGCLPVGSTLLILTINSTLNISLDFALTVMLPSVILCIAKVHFVSPYGQLNFHLICPVSFCVYICLGMEGTQLVSLLLAMAGQLCPGMTHFSCTRIRLTPHPPHQVSSRNKCDADGGHLRFRTKPSLTGPQTTAQC